MEREEDDVDLDAEFSLRLGTSNPYWTVTADSNALGLGGSLNTIRLASELTDTDADRIRSLGEEIAVIRCSVRWSDSPKTLYLIGRRISEIKWRGVASSDQNFIPAESLLSELDEPMKSNVVSIRRKRIG